MNPTPVSVKVRLTESEITSSLFPSPEQRLCSLAMIGMHAAVRTAAQKGTNAFDLAVPCP
jgi:hypothetical protein